MKKKSMPRSVKLPNKEEHIKNKKKTTFEELQTP
jgi:hypothetical protein